jgi:3-oxoacyl-[acyl-carrier-protein] synthase II
MALSKAFGQQVGVVKAHSTKSMIGHLLGGASATEAVADIQAIQRGIIHPSINLFEQDPEVHLNLVTETMEVPGIRHILSDAFGFGGQNASIVISKFEG